MGVEEEEEEVAASEAVGTGLEACVRMSEFPLCVPFFPYMIHAYFV